MQNAKRKLQNVVTVLLIYNLLLPCSNPFLNSNIKQKQSTQMCALFSWHAGRDSNAKLTMRMRDSHCALR